MTTLPLTFLLPQAQAVATGGAVAGLTPAQAAQLQRVLDNPNLIPAIV